MFQILLVVLKRTLALTILKVTGVIAAGSIAGVELWQSAIVAAWIGIVEVAEDLSRAYTEDGVIDPADVDRAFRKASRNK